ncbi:hypothetical protein [Spirillospora sp. CA-294931]|uniref:hypothetical protein n=1 Tax=Spirillospora sp. CA-294931 TaxID=3240042 RepID=UPI003D925E8E
MPRTALTPEKFVTAGLSPTPITPDPAGVQFRNNGEMVLMVTNGSGASINVTPKIAKSVEGVVPTSPARAVAAGATRFFGPFDEQAYAQPDGTANMHIDLSAVASVTVSLLQMP